MYLSMVFLLCAMNVSLRIGGGLMLNNRLEVLEQIENALKNKYSHNPSLAYSYLWGYAQNTLSDEQILNLAEQVC